MQISVVAKHCLSSTAEASGRQLFVQYLALQCLYSQTNAVWMAIVCPMFGPCNPPSSG